MNKKLLVGSIVAVVILVLVSFTGVVGYQTTKSSTIAKASPLFSVRSKRVLNQEQEITPNNYLGKDKDIGFSIPKRDNEQEILQRIMNMITKMDDRAFNKFINSVIERIYQSNKVGKDVTLEQLQLLYQLKYTPEDFKRNQFNIKRSKADPPTRYSFVDECCNTWLSDPECTRFWMIIFFIMLVGTILYDIAEIIIYYYCLIAPFTPTIE